MTPRGNNSDRRYSAVDARVEEVAAEWFFRRDRGFTADEHAQFSRWLAADVRHAEVFGDIEASWAAFGRLGERVVETAGFQQSNPSQQPAAGAGFPGASERTPFRPAWVLAAAAAVLVGFFLWSRPVGSQPVTQTIAAAAGTVRQMALPDGSKVQLNADSVLEVGFTTNERSVRLVRGEAHFTVEKNPARPFVVRAGNVGVRAVGTAFNVRLAATALEVLVTEGKVRVLHGPASMQSAVDRDGRPQTPTAANVGPDLTVGQRATIPFSDAATSTPNVSVVTVPAVEIEQALSWQKRRVDYTDASLADIVADFNRYNAHQLIIEDPTLAARRFGANFPAGDYDALVRLLETTSGVVAERRENVTVLRLR